MELQAGISDRGIARKRATRGPVIDGSTVGSRSEGRRGPIRVRETVPQADDQTHDDGDVFTRVRGGTISAMSCVHHDVSKPREAHTSCRAVRRGPRIIGAPHCGQVQAAAGVTGASRNRDAGAPASRARASARRVMRQALAR